MRGLIKDSDLESGLASMTGGLAGSMSKQTESSSSSRRFCQSKRTFLLRMSFLVCMIVATGVCASVAYVVTRNLEEDVAKATYESVATSALQEAQAITHRKQDGAKVLTSVLGFAFPEAQMWPNIGLRGYHTIAQKVAKLSSTSGMGLMTIVKPEQAQSFEEHAYQLYRDFGYPETAGWSNFGFGIYGQSQESPYPDGRFHDTLGNTTYGSPHSIMAPFLQHSNSHSNPNLLMMNLHQQPFRGGVMDSMIDCAHQAESLNDESSPSCFVVTGFTEIFVRPGPAAVLFEPIFPADDPTTLVGFVGTSIHWEEVLTNVVPDYVDGLDCVISSGEESFTYVMHHGKPELVGDGDRHDRGFSEYGRSVELTEFDTLATASYKYTLTVYPTSLMFDEFRTQIPVYVAVGFAAILLGCIGMFFLYDYFMKYKAGHRKKVLAMKRRFVRFISHEIRTPLNVVSMGLELLRSELREDRGNQSPPRQQLLQEGQAVEETKNLDKSSYLLDLTGDILENTQNAVSVLNDLLNYDKIEMGTFQIELNPVDIWRIVKKTASEFSIQARNRKITMEVSLATETIAPDSPTGANHDDLDQLRVIGDDIRLTQAIRNLVSNALKFSPVEGDGKISVSASYDPHGLPILPKQLEDECHTRGGSVQITVTDNGVGLSESRLGLLFSEGVQFDANKLQAGGGSGLGLCIAKEIVEQHGGTINVFSEGPGKGTSFIVELPLFRFTAGKETTTERDFTHTLSTVSSVPPRRRHILVVDDSLSNTKMLVRLLERAGHTSVVARDGQQAVDKYKEAMQNRQDGKTAEPFDTILMDFHMPNMSGPEATKKLRDMGCTCPVIGITGNVLGEDVAYFKTSGADSVLLKPVMLSDIEACWSRYSGTYAMNAADAV